MCKRISLCYTYTLKRGVLMKKINITLKINDYELKTDGFINNEIISFKDKDEKSTGSVFCPGSVPAPFACRFRSGRGGSGTGRLHLRKRQGGYRGGRVGGNLLLRGPAEILAACRADPHGAHRGSQGSRLSGLLSLRKFHAQCGLSGLRRHQSGGIPGCRHGKRCPRSPHGGSQRRGHRDL